MTTRPRDWEVSCRAILCAGVALCAVPAVACGQAQAAPAIDDMPAAKADPNDWPWWRGPAKNNVAAAGQDPPLEWSETTNVVWRAELPGLGHGTPCIAGGRMVLATADTRRRTISLLCLDRKGKGYIFKAGRELELLAENTLPAGAFATPVFLDNRIYLRTMTDLFCLGK